MSAVHFTNSKRRFLQALFLAILGLLATPAQGATNEPSPWGETIERDFPFFSSTLDARDRTNPALTNNLTPRGIILQLGGGAWACFDVDLLRISAIWVGSGVTPVSMSQGSYHLSGAKAPEGQDSLPKPDGLVWMANGIYPGWQAGLEPELHDPRDPGPDAREVGRGPLTESHGRFKSLQALKGGVRLSYTADGNDIREFVSSGMEQGGPYITRSFELNHVERPLCLVLGFPDKSRNIGVSLQSNAPENTVILNHRADGLVTVGVKASASPIQFSVILSTGTGDPRHIRPPANTGPFRRWPQSVETQSVLSISTNAYVVDDIPIPSANPWRRNIRLTDIAFLKDGRAAAVTYDGDVWMISGLGSVDGKCVWRRFTSGLHEPLGICTRDEELFVFDRNGIWKLTDTDGDGEADTHELFSNAFAQTAETREFAAGIRPAPDGSFVIGKGGQEGTTIGKHNGSVLRISADGRKSETLAYGLRQVFIGVNPRTGLVTASDQQGHYVPATPLHLIRDGQFYGFLPLILPKEKYPAPIAEPLTWIPHPINPSGAGQAWLEGARMGPLNGSLIHFGYYRPEVFVVTLDQRAEPMQAAVMSLTRDLPFAPLAGAVNPADGQLYIAGMQIWGSAAQRISGLARLRYTGAESTFPHEITPMDKGILIRFDVAMDPSTATNPANYSIERWNYVRTAEYGSPHFKTDGGRGQDALTASSAYLSRDGRKVFIGIPDMKPVMQMRLGWSLKTRLGLDAGHNAFFSPRRLAAFAPESEGFDPLQVDLTPRQPLADVPGTPITIEEGRRLSELMGCVACHSIDGTTIGKVGPSWKGLPGRLREFATGPSQIADENYLRESILQPSAKVVKGFEKSDTGMPSYDGVLAPRQIEALILYIKSLAE